MSSYYFKSFIQFFSTNFFVKIVSFIKELFMAWIIGPGYLLDLFFFISNIPNIVNSTWNKAFETVLLSSYQKDNNSGDTNEAKRKLNYRIINLTLISLILYFILSISFPIYIYFFYQNYFSNSTTIAVFFVNFVFVIETYILTIKVVKLSERDFFLISILPIFQNIILIIGIIYLNYKINLFTLAILYSIGSLFQCTFFFKKELRIFIKLFSIKWYKGSLDGIFVNSLKISLAAGISSMNLFIDQSFALSIGKSANTYIHFGYYFLTIYSILIVKNINTIFFPQFQQYILDKEHTKLISDVRKTIKLILIISMSIVVLIAGNGFYILDLVLGHGKISESDIQNIYYCTLAYGGVFFGTAINAVLIRVIHVYNEYHLLVYIAVINFILNLVLNYFFTTFFGVWGIALSTSVTILIIVSIYLLYFAYYKNIIFIENKSWFKKFILSFILIGLFEILLSRIFDGFVQMPLSKNILIGLLNIVSLVTVLYLFKLLDIKKMKINFN